MKKLTVLLLLCNIPLFCFAQLRPQSIAVFKNGQSFVIRSGKVPTPQGKFTLRDDLPSALFGTLWFDAADGDIASVTAFQDSVSVKKEVGLADFGLLLRENEGASVALRRKGTGEDLQALVRGRVEKVYYRPDGASVIMLQGNNGYFAVKEEEITTVTFDDRPELNLQAESVEMQTVAEVNFSNPKPAHNLRMMYLQNGLRWTPQYLLELRSDERADLTLQAEISNDAADIDDVSLDLVVGVPNFKFATRQAGLLDFLQNYRPQPRPTDGFANTFSNVASQQITYGIEAAPTDDLRNATGTTGSENEDLFFYNLPNFSLPAGGRTVQRLFTENVKIAHLYETNLRGNTENANSYQSEYLFSPNTQNPVYHVVKIENTLRQPWTTAPILVMNDQDNRSRPVSQDVMNYTAAGSNAFVKLTETPEIKITHAEKEIAAVPDAKRWNNRRYTKVKVAGQLKVKSYKNKKIDLNVRRQILGTLLKSETDWLTAEVINTSGSPNRKNNVCWELSLPAKGEVTIDYEYEIFLLR